MYTDPMPKTWSILFKALRVVMGVVLAVGVTTVPAAAADSKASARVYPNAESVQPRSVGEPVPNVTIQTIDGNSVDLAGLLEESGALLVFYRGGW